MLILAQQINLNPQDILARLAPRTNGVYLVYDIILYIVFILALVVMFMQSDKQLVPTMLAGLVGALAVIAKLNVFDPLAFGALVVNAGIFVFPIIIAGITKAKKSQPLAVIAGVLGGVYFFMFWFISQRGG
ncbi:MAG: hypothetical protein HZC41_13245 [Chloroflexi bacterium]|nr:hypothetical protein [Chloroflexota bacterium]